MELHRWYVELHRSFRSQGLEQGHAVELRRRKPQQEVFENRAFYYAICQKLTFLYTFSTRPRVCNQFDQICLTPTLDQHFHNNHLASVLCSVQNSFYLDIPLPRLVDGNQAAMLLWNMDWLQDNVFLYNDEASDQPSVQLSTCGQF